MDSATTNLTDEELDVTNLFVYLQNFFNSISKFFNNLIAAIRNIAGELFAKEQPPLVDEI